MLRIICCENEHTHAVHVGGPADIRYRSFDVAAPEVEEWLDAFEHDKSRSYNVRSIVGIERFNPQPPNADGQQQ